MEVVFPPKEAKGKKRYRTVLLTDGGSGDPHAADGEVSGGAAVPQRGRRAVWTRYSVANRFARLKKHVGEKFAQVSFRHGFCQKMLESGVDHIAVAELMGHFERGYGGPYLLVT